MLSSIAISIRLSLVENLIEGRGFMNQVKNKYIMHEKLKIKKNYKWR